MIWFVICYAIAGAWCAFRLVPWGQRVFFVARVRADTWWAKLLGAAGVSACVMLAWPCYAWVTWREGSALPDDPLGESADADGPPEVDYDLISRAMRDAGWRPNEDRTEKQTR